MIILLLHMLEGGTRRGMLSLIWFPLAWLAPSWMGNHPVVRTDKVLKRIQSIRGLTCPFFWLIQNLVNIFTFVGFKVWRIMDILQLFALTLFLVKVFLLRRCFLWLLEGALFASLLAFFRWESCRENHLSVIISHELSDHSFGFDSETSMNTRIGEVHILENGVNFFNHLGYYHLDSYYNSNEHLYI